MHSNITTAHSCKDTCTAHRLVQFHAEDKWQFIPCSYILT